MWQVYTRPTSASDFFEQNNISAKNMHIFSGFKFKPIPPHNWDNKVLGNICYRTKKILALFFGNFVLMSMPTQKF
jgi:hypothetical protein